MKITRYKFSQTEQGTMKHRESEEGEWVLWWEVEEKLKRLEDTARFFEGCLKQAQETQHWLIERFKSEVGL